MPRTAAAKRTLFREVNERIRDVNASFGLTSSYEILCECAGIECARRVRVPGAVFQAAAGETQQFVVAPGHDRPSERIVCSGPTYAVISNRTRSRPRAVTAAPLPA